MRGTRDSDVAMYGLRMLHHEKYAFASVGSGLPIASSLATVA